MTKFNVGDKVRFIDGLYGGIINVGHITYKLSDGAMGIIRPGTGFNWIFLPKELDKISEKISEEDYFLECI